MKRTSLLGLFCIGALAFAIDSDAQMVDGKFYRSVGTIDLSRHPGAAAYLKASNDYYQHNDTSARQWVTLTPGMTELETELHKLDEIMTAKTRKSESKPAPEDVLFDIFEYITSADFTSQRYVNSVGRFYQRLKIEAEKDQESVANSILTKITPQDKIQLTKVVNTKGDIDRKFSDANLDLIAEVLSRKELDERSPGNFQRIADILYNFAATKGDNPESQAAPVTVIVDAHDNSCCTIC